MRLKDFLAADNVRAYVNDVVVWANPERPPTVENPTVAVWQYDRLSDELGNLWQSAKLSQADQNKIITKLSKLCETKDRS
jgi:hypothetical protein